MSDSALHLVERVTRLEAKWDDIKDDVVEIKNDISMYSEKFESCQRQALEKLNLLLEEQQKRKTYEKIAAAILKSIGAVIVAVGSVLASNWWQGRGH
jgi:uncharacterized protein (UPF0335 family)